MKTTNQSVMKSATTVADVPTQTRKRWRMLIDLRRCNGCQGCTVACRKENAVPRGKSRRRVRSVSVGTPNGKGKKRQFVPLSCFHCAQPACLAACEEGAIYQNDAGYVLIDKTKCKTRQGCVTACPYDSIFISPVDNKADKCTFCVHRIRQGEAPVCAKTCRGGAILFGDLDDPTSIVAQTMHRKEAKSIQPHAGAEPLIAYLGLTADVKAGILGSVRKSWCR